MTPVRVARLAGSLLLALVVLALPGRSFAQVAVSITLAPPVLPVYTQPVCPGEGYLWTPGYWAWDVDFGDYYWVPGTWVLAVLRAWLAEHPGQPDQPLLPARDGGRLSRDAVERRLAKHTAAATKNCPSLKTKNITAHTMRHTAAMRLLHAGVDTSVIALWLGHEQAETTQIYLHADLALKERALARTTPPNTKPGRYQPPEQLLAFLETL